MTFLPLAYAKSVAFPILVPEFCRDRWFVEYVGIIFRAENGQ